MRRFRFRGYWRASLIYWLLCGTAAADGLSDALQATMRNHPAVAGQEAEVAARRHAADAVRSQRYPTLLAQAQQYADDARASDGDDLSQPYVLRVRQPIWAFGRIDDSIAVADAEVSTERADLLRVRRLLLEDTAVAYATVRGSQQQIDIAKQNVTELEVLSDQIERRVAGQLASSADSRLAAARLAEARALRERAISEWDGAIDDLVGFTQVTVGTDEPVPAELLALHGPTDLIETAIDQSAEIAVKQRQLGQAEREVDRARTAPMPTIYLQADRYYDQPGLDDDGQASIVFEASLDGLGFAARGRTAEAVSNRTAASQDLAVAKVDLTREIKRLQRNRALSAELIGLRTQSQSDLTSLLASYQRQYESGTKSWLDLLNVQRELFEQRHQLVQAQTEWRIYSLQLLARMGGLDGLAGIDGRNDGR
jgi:adhesin transport system outer membrane protein